LVSEVIKNGRQVVFSIVEANKYGELHFDVDIDTALDDRPRRVETNAQSERPICNQDFKSESLGSCGPSLPNKGRGKIAINFSPPRNAAHQLKLELEQIKTVILDMAIMVSRLDKEAE
jgi:hypothetical protein